MSSPSLTLGDQEYPGLRDTLNAVCEAAVKLVGVEHSGLVLFTPDKEYGEVITEYPILENSVVGQRFRIKDIEHEQQLVQRRQEMVVRDVANESSLGVVQTVLVDMGVKSIVVVPIIVDNEVRGSFSFDSLGEMRNFGDVEVEKCKSLAKFASLVVKNLYLLKNLDGLRKAMLAISSEPERVPLLQKITEQAVLLLKATGGGIDELDSRKKELTIVAKFQMPDHIVGKTMKIGEGLAGSIIERNMDALAEPDYQNWDNKAPYFKDEKSLESLLGVPLRWNDKTTGVLWLNDKQPRLYSTEDIELLKGLAEPASIALEHSSLREKEKGEARRLRELAKATNEIFVNLATASRQQRLDLIAQKAHEIIDAELCGILLVEQPGWLTLEAGHGYADDKFEKGKHLEITSEDGKGLTGFIASTGEIFNECGEVLTRNPKRRSSVDGLLDYSPSGHCFSLLGIPLKAEGGELKGLITINNKNDKDGKPNEWTCFSKDDVAIAEIFAQAALVAIETADLQDRNKALFETSKLALTKLPEEGLAALATMVLQQINKSFCRILLHHEADRTIQVIAAEKASGPKGEFQWKQRLGETTKVDKWIGLEDSLETGQFVVQKRGINRDFDTNLDNLSMLIELRDEFGTPLRIHSLLRGPLKVKEQIIGLLIIGELDPAADFSPFEVALTKSIAEQASQFIERLESNKKLLLDLFETERKIYKSADASSALMWVARTIYAVGRAYGRNVTVVDVNVRNGNMVRVVAAYPEQQLEYIRKQIGDPFDLSVGFGDDHRIGLVGRVLHSGEALKESDVRNNPDYIPIHKDTLSQMIVPIRDDDEVVGALSVESAEASAFDDQDVVLVEGIAVLAGSALSREKHSREYKKVRTVALAGAAAQLWRHGLPQMGKSIVERIDDALQNNLPDLKAVLAGIKSDASYIENYHFIPLSSKDEDVATEPLYELLSGFLDAFRQHLDLKGIICGFDLKLEQSRNRKVSLNRAWFQKALSIFLENARAAITSATEKRIEVETVISEDSRFCQIRIKNTGAKIDDEIWEKMTQEQILKNGHNEKGNGLLLADLILAVYGGKIEKIKNEENNIVLGVTLPLVP